MRGRSRNVGSRCLLRNSRSRQTARRPPRTWPPRTPWSWTSRAPWPPSRRLGRASHPLRLRPELASLVGLHGTGVHPLTLITTTIRATVIACTGADVIASYATSFTYLGPRSQKAGVFACTLWSAHALLSSRTRCCPVGMKNLRIFLLHQRGDYPPAQRSHFISAHSEEHLPTRTACFLPSLQ